MNANIRDREYNVETAKQVAQFGNDVPRSEVHWLETALYLTADGYWFVYAEGGPATIYGEEVGDHCADGEFLRPLSPEGARAWLEMCGELDAVREYFPNAQPTSRKSETTGTEVRSILGVEMP
jgi:hypothetical protein